MMAKQRASLNKVIAGLKVPTTLRVLLKNGPERMPVFGVDGLTTFIQRSAMIMGCAWEKRYDLTFFANEGNGLDTFAGVGFLLVTSILLRPVETMFALESVRMQPDIRAALGIAQVKASQARWVSLNQLAAILQFQSSEALYHAVAVVSEMKFVFGTDQNVLYKVDPTNPHFHLIIVLVLAIMFCPKAAIGVVYSIFGFQMLHPDSDAALSWNITLAEFPEWCPTLPKYELLGGYTDAIWQSILDDIDDLKYPKACLYAREQTDIQRQRFWRKFDLHHKVVLKRFAKTVQIAQEECSICLNAQSVVRFDPCGHMVTCQTCAAAWKGTCPLCRAVITGRKVTDILTGSKKRRKARRKRCKQ